MRARSRRRAGQFPSLLPNLGGDSSRTLGTLTLMQDRHKGQTCIGLRSFARMIDAIMNPKSAECAGRSQTLPGLGNAPHHRLFHQAMALFEITSDDQLEPIVQTTFRSLGKLERRHIQRAIGARHGATTRGLRTMFAETGDAQSRIVMRERTLFDILKVKPSEGARCQVAVRKKAVEQAAPRPQRRSAADAGVYA